MPLVFILLVGALKDGYEDYLRHKTDNATNQKPVTVIRNKKSQIIQTQNLCSGDFVVVHEFDLLVSSVIHYTHQRRRNTSRYDYSYIDRRKWNCLHKHNESGWGNKP